MARSSCVLLTTPAFTDDEVFLENEDAIAIFNFFWPEHQTRINSLSLSLHTRALAQQILVFGVNATYGLGFIESLTRAFMGPQRSLKGALRKLAQKSASHWFNCATGKNLQKPQIAYSVKTVTRSAYKNHILELLEGIAVNTPPIRFFAHTNTIPRRFA
jgi:hypothetical protein